jgi:hypothetical protein
MVALLSNFLGSPLFYLFAFEEQCVARWNVTAMNSFLSLVASIVLLNHALIFLWTCSQSTVLDCPNAVKHNNCMPMSFDLVPS